MGKHVKNRKDENNNINNIFVIKMCCGNMLVFILLSHINGETFCSFTIDKSRCSVHSEESAIQMRYLYKTEFKLIFILMFDSKPRCVDPHYLGNTC